MLPGKRLREPVNFYTHFIPALLALPAGWYLFSRAASPLERTAALVYSIGTCILFAVSAIYHGYPRSEYGIRFWQKFDHCCIYLMIAGSYTPTALLVFDGWLRWGLFATVWFVALAGCLLKIFNRLKSTGVSLALYILMGCLILPLLYQMSATLPGGAIFWLLLGGVFYIGGTYFYAQDRQMHRLLHSHELWHLFVAGGALSHYVYNYVYIFKS
ncbi:hemolysin III family protein [Pedobacter sp. SYP-B3415]|uniref:PAQR family membrane homeostasis protein TrhA n=1 Tax=Pedobacter sp. SYP-B3415 TaxID=2496641 RepID=UPI00101C065E|nr:hemolysin III family protein [Pedobacter sp. SYP-B3415]